MGFYSKRVGYIPLEIDKIYTSKKEMDENFSTDGVFIGRFVLIDYGDPYIDLDNYNTNAQKDDNSISVSSPEEIVNECYDNTIWQKTKDGYVQVAHLNAQIPAFTYTLADPGYFDSAATDYAERVGTRLYNIKVARPWEFTVGTFNYGKEGFDPQNYGTAAPTATKEITLSPKDKKKNRTLSNGYNDTQEITFNLGILGNTASKMWDEVLGNYRNGLTSEEIDEDKILDASSYDNSMLGRVNYALARINAAAEVIDNVLIYAEPISETAWEILINKKIKDGLNTDRDTILEIAQFFVGAEPANQTLADIQNILEKIPEGDPFSFTDDTKRKFVLRAGDTMTGNLQFGANSATTRPVIKYFGITKNTDYGSIDPIAHPENMPSGKAYEGSIYFRYV